MTTERSPNRKPRYRQTRRAKAREALKKGYTDLIRTGETPASAQEIMSISAPGVNSLKALDPAWAEEVRQAAEYARLQAQGAVDGLLPKAVEVMGAGIGQTEDMRAALDTAYKLLRGRGVLVDGQMIAQRTEITLKDGRDPRLVALTDEQLARIVAIMDEGGDGNSAEG